MSATARWRAGCHEGGECGHSGNDDRLHLDPRARVGIRVSTIIARALRVALPISNAVRGGREKEHVMPITIKVDYEPGKAAIQGYTKQIEVPVTGPASQPGVRISYSIQIRWYLPTPEAYVPYRTVKTTNSTSMGVRMRATAMLTLRNQVRSAQPTIPDGPHVRNVKRTLDMLAVHDLPGPSSKIVNLADSTLYPIRFAAVFSVSLYEKLPHPPRSYDSPDFSPKRNDVGNLFPGSTVDYYIELEKAGVNAEFKSRFELIHPTPNVYDGWLPR
jgi:hypothetical protein